MAGWHGLALSLNGAVAPRLQDVVHAMERPFFRPQDEQGALDFLIQVRLIVRQVDGRGGTVIFANRMDRFGAAEGAEIFLKYRGPNPFRQGVRNFVPAKPEQRALQKIFGAVGDHRLRKRRRLNEQKPVVKNRGKFLGNVLVEQIRWDDIENDQLGEQVRVIECHAVRGAAPAIVPHYGELLKSQVLHYFHLVLRHGPFGIGGMIVASRRLTAISISAKIRHHEKRVSRQGRSDLAPEYMRLRDAMKEQQGRPFVVATINGIDRCPGSLDLLALEALKKIRARLLTRIKLARNPGSKQRALVSGCER